MFLGKTPKKIDAKVISLKSLIPDSGEPIYLKLKQEKYAKLSSCISNVKEKVKKDLGSIQYGWIVWYVPGLMIEGEFHAVWKNHNGELIDITPKSGGEKLILFIPDYKTVYNGEFIKNIIVPFNFISRKICRIANNAECFIKELPIGHKPSPLEFIKALLR